MPLLFIFDVAVVAVVFLTLDLVVAAAAIAVVVLDIIAANKPTKNKNPL